MSIRVRQKSIVNMAGSNRPLPMDTALKTVSEASIHVTKSDQNLTGKNHIGSETSSRKNSMAENSLGELHTTASMDNVRSGSSSVFDESKLVSTSKYAGVSVTSSNSNSISSTASQSGRPQSGKQSIQPPTGDEAVVGNLVNGPGTIPAKARKSSFQIMRVTGSTPGGAAVTADQNSSSGSQVGSVLDAMEDADESTPNTGSEGHDISHSTADLSEDTETSADTLRSPNSETDGDAFLTSTGAISDQSLPRIVVPVTASSPAGILAVSATSTANGTNGKSSPVVDIQSRFKIVKILNRVRGRWKCLDFAGPPMSAAESAGNKSDSPPMAAGMVVRMQDSGTADTLIDVSQLVSSVPSTHDGIVGMSQNFYRTDANTTLGQIAGTVRSSSDPAFADRSSMEANCDPNNQTLLNPSRGGESIDDTTESSIDAAGSFALDNKIEQAMDLVKSHLMFAVHEEVELLKEQIKELTIKNGQLEYENTVLRASATSETLAKLQPPTAPHTGLS